MLSHVQPTLDRPKYDGIIIHVPTRTNNVSPKRKRHSDNADSIISVGKKCQDTGIEYIMISSLLCRKNPKLQAKINEVNDVSKDLCTLNIFVFIDNTNLIDCDICENIPHLSYSDTCKIGAINNMTYFSS